MSELGAGRELDALVAVAIFGWPERVYITDERHDPARPIYAWKECHRKHGEEETCECAWLCGQHEFYEAPRYSTDIAAAWSVVEKMREYPDARFRTLRLVAYSYSRTYASFDSMDEGEDWHEANGEHATPLAICKAALAAATPPRTPMEGREGSHE